MRNGRLLSFQQANLKLINCKNTISKIKVLSRFTMRVLGLCRFLSALLFLFGLKGVIWHLIL